MPATHGRSQYRARPNAARTLFRYSKAPSVANVSGTVTTDAMVLARVRDRGQATRAEREAIVDRIETARAVQPAG